MLVFFFFFFFNFCASAGDCNETGEGGQEGGRWVWVGEEMGMGATGRGETVMGQRGGRDRDGEMGRDRSSGKGWEWGGGDGKRQFGREGGQWEGRDGEGATGRGRQ